MQIMSYGDNIGFTENLRNEFKELRLNKLNIDKEETIKIIKNYNYFVCMCNKSVITYIKEYLPKYATSFLNRGLNDCNIYIGVNDAGELIGFPVDINTLSDFEIEIQSCVNYIIEYRILKSGNNHERFEISCKLNRINVNNINIDPLDSIIDSHNLKVKEYECKRFHTNQIRSKIRSSMLFYHQSINIVINNSFFRKELIAFISKVNQNGVHNELIKILNDQNEIYFSDGQISLEKHLSTTLSYWVTTFREQKTKQIKKIKKILPKLKFVKSKYQKLLADHIPLLENAISQKNCDLYILQITITQDIQNTCMFLYKDETDVLRKVIRYITMGHPSTHTI